MRLHRRDGKTNPDHDDDAISRFLIRTFVRMENDGVITHEQTLKYADISEEEYVNLALSYLLPDKKREDKREHTVRVQLSGR